MYKNIIFFFLFLTLTGCGQRTTSVTGTVTLDGTGLKDIVVLLQPASDAALTPEAAFGRTDEQGRFTLSLINSKKRGVVPGEYVVFINWNDPNPAPENEPANPCPYKIPSSAKDGSRRCTIENQKSQQIDFELSDFPNKIVPRKI
ncbi:hypothetical protein FACS18942_10340 [Planctomycetales bacterium]|nr:hypothetical protein FACS18942_10340 [Planctomycetales bacterium]